MLRIHTCWISGADYQALLPAETNCGSCQLQQVYLVNWEETSFNSLKNWLQANKRLKSNKNVEKRLQLWGCRSLTWILFRIHSEHGQGVLPHYHLTEFIGNKKGRRVGFQGQILDVGRRAGEHVKGRHHLQSTGLALNRT